MVNQFDMIEGKESVSSYNLYDSMDTSAMTVETTSETTSKSTFESLTTSGTETTNTDISTFSSTEPTLDASLSTENTATFSSSSLDLSVEEI